MRRETAAAFSIALFAFILLSTLPGHCDTTYTVRRGDSVSAIARRFRVPYRLILQANHLTERSLIYPGQKLAIPDRASAPPRAALPDAPQLEVYVVRQGDTLWEIAQSHGTTVEALAQANGLSPDGVLQVGTRLLLPPAGQASQQHRFVAAALEYQGVRYRYGGMTSRGMDCSGLVARVLQTYGIDAPHNSQALSKLGVPVSRENLRPGDLVFFHTTRPGVSHVGIYLGDGKFIHASSRQGRVRVDRLDEGYYSQRFVGARRIY